jgi:hypothetical protein
VIGPGRTGDLYIGPVATDGFTNADCGIASATAHLRKAVARELNCDVSGFCMSRK